jgi:cell wall-associated NlpC family hydrolase
LPLPVVTRRALRSALSAGVLSVVVGVGGMLMPGAVQAQTAPKGEPPRPFARFSASAQALRDSVVSIARSQLGTRYKLGGTTPNVALDCSALVRHVMAAFDLRLPRTAQQQAATGIEVPRQLDALKPGDLLTFGRGTRISHVGIYVGDGRMVHASTSRRRVVETALTPRSPLVRQWKGVRRLIPADSVLRDSLLALADSLSR